MGEKKVMGWTVTCDCLYWLINDLVLIRFLGHGLLGVIRLKMAS